MRTLTVALLVVLAGLAGCLQAGEPVEPTGRDAPANDTDVASEPDASAEDEGDQKSETEGDGTAATEDDEAGPNRTEDDPADAVRSTLPGNLSMEGAQVLERTEERVVFRWQSSLSPGQRARDSVPQSSFDVPADRPLKIRANLSWSGASNLRVVVFGEHVDVYCSSSGELDPGQQEGSTACSVRTFPRSSWDAWRVGIIEQVGQAGLRVTLGPKTSANYTVDLTIEVADPWTGPPVDVPSADDPPLSPGWPAIEDAEIRPGTKAGSISEGINSFTSNFVFSSPGNSTLYLGTVAHGVDGLEPGDTKPLPTLDVDATLVYCSWGIIEETVTCPDLDSNTHPRAVNDFALLRLPDRARSMVHPAVPFWGGPTGLASPPGQGDDLLAFGNTPFRDGGREGVNAFDPKVGVTTASEPVETRAHFASPGIDGDSGGPVMTANGGALGLFHAIGLDGGNTVSNVPHAISYMENQTALDVELKTWHLFDQPRAEDLGDAPAGPPD